MHGYKGRAPHIIYQRTFTSHWASFLDFLPSSQHLNSLSHERSGRVGFQSETMDITHKPPPQDASVSTSDILVNSFPSPLPLPCRRMTLRRRRTKRRGRRRPSTMMKMRRKKRCAGYDGILLALYPLRYPCACSGSIKFVHLHCLLRWLNYSNARQYEVMLSLFSSA